MLKEINEILKEISELKADVQALKTPYKRILNIKEACNYIGISRNTLMSLVRNGEIRAQRIGNKYFFTIEAINNYFDRDNDFAINIIKNIRLTK